jgi:hypothetical protein
MRDYLGAMIDRPAMNRLALLMAAAAIWATSAPAAAVAQDRAAPAAGSPRWIWNYDNRDDNRDFPTNGFFPGDFAAHPATAWIGAAGILGSNPEHAVVEYPSQFVVGSPRDQSYCARHYRSYDPASGTFVGNDHVRHRCG